MNKSLSFLFFAIVFTGECYTQSGLEFSVNIGYSRPLLEAYGGKITINNALDQIFIDGERILISDRLGARNGFSVQTFLKYSFFRKGYVKALFNAGYNNLFHSEPINKDFEPGVRIQSFSLGCGAEISPIGSDRKFYPSVSGLLRLNFMGGETYYATGIDFFKVTPRFGYVSAFNLNYTFRKNTGVFLGYSYNFENVWNRSDDETPPDETRTIVFRDKSSPTNGLDHDRRVAYWSLYLGVNFFFK
ncbi:MAG: hypothetical protein N2510_01150 [Ignavibacteria bacterium]|nr:hypothetical protein [Ignavibacteria bacterium]